NVAARLGWTWAGLSDLGRAAGLETTIRDPVELRSSAATCLSGVDLRKVAVLSEGWSASCLSFSPDGKRLAIGKYRGVPAFWVDLIDMQSRQGMHRLPLLGIPPMGKTGVRELTFSPDGRWL